MPNYSAEDFTEVYHVHTVLEANRIVDVILRPEGVEGVVHDREDHALLAPDTQPGAYHIAVPLEQRDRAVEALRVAREAGYLTDGDFAGDY